MFREITLADKPLFDYHFRQQEYEGSECTFTNMFMWRKLFNIEWTEIMGFLCIRADRHNHPFYLPPFGPNNEKVVEVIDELIALCEQQRAAFRMKGVYKNTVQLLEQLRPGRFAFTTDRNNSDYIYLAQDLIGLKGRKYHSKKNHVNTFRTSYPDYKYVPLTEDLLAGCADFTIRWCEMRGEDDIDLEMEKCAVLEALRHYRPLGYQGGVILIGGQIEAFSIGEPLNKDMAVIHVEKANPDIKGLYAVINQDFCRYTWSGMQYINREEDMGIEGLRKAKESYKPVRMTDKFDAVLV